MNKNVTSLANHIKLIFNIEKYKYTYEEDNSYVYYDDVTKSYISIFKKLNVVSSNTKACYHGIMINDTRINKNLLSLYKHACHLYGINPYTFKCGIIIEEVHSDAIELLLVIIGWPDKTICLLNFIGSLTPITNIVKDVPIEYGKLYLIGE